MSDKYFNLPLAVPAYGKFPDNVMSIGAGNEMTNFWTQLLTNRKPVDELSYQDLINCADDNIAPRDLDREEKRRKDYGVAYDPKVDQEYHAGYGVGGKLCQTDKVKSKRLESQLPIQFKVN